MMSNAILMALVPVFFVLLLGYAAGKFHIVDNLHVDALNALVMDFALPASLFAATASASRRDMIEQVPLSMVLGVTMLLLYVAWYCAARRFSKASRSDASLQALTIGFPNLAGVGLPILSSVSGPAGTVPVAVALATGSILISPLTLIMVEMGASRAQGAELSMRQILTAVRRAITKPVVLAPAAGILLSLSDVSLDALAHACLALIGSAAAGVALFLTGAILSAQSFRLDWRIVAATAASDVVRPLLAIAVIHFIPIAPDPAKTAILLAAVPSGFFGILFAVNYRLDSATAGSMVIASTGFSVVTLAIAIAMLFPG
ncbi:AEC family transporter [Bradyrhizobium diazoefficiens]|uniref:Malonate decarboxylase n=1 Tax=Bradyrhizobium diazoefficiens TaxID=1355477 RepID=A0A809YXA6_9BRAD|nr:AEC family transporter [Bradyrhizobium diazoefficiens]WLA74339.1 AEC family transporter [Bradyrhizobium diazoefficiens]BCE17582.1 malonate decarboxylase [Bradyrhizobium diazoefficiens]BCE43915.1 malonate decarboxylase [Bradyrhizobium diazoefficiens]BCE87463.1 malonate decarboxylase [Bradyrhizobium diazoefficiens]BCF22310.1 malonate decarboxylase [Bradyrhizobium diazoefficiens]